MRTTNSAHGILACGVVLAGLLSTAAWAAEPTLSVKPRGYIQGDARYFDDDAELEQTDTFLLRRARLNFDGTYGDEISFRIGAEFGSGRNGELYDAYVDWKALPVGSLRAGKFKVPIGLERLQSNSRLLFRERSLVDNLIPNRDVGIAWQTSGRLEAALGIFNQATDRRREDEDVDDDKVVAARVFGKPFTDGVLQGLAVGVGGSYGQADQAPVSSTSVTTGGNTIFRYAAGTRRDGTEQRISPQFYWYAGSFGLLGEYVISELELTDGTIEESIDNDAWQIAGSWVITGEKNGWRGIKPDRPYQLGGGGWGAWELVARVSELDLDDDLFPIFANPETSVSKARAYEVGLNWYPNPVLKVILNLAQTEFDGGAPGGLDRPDEKLLLAGLQLAF